MEKITERVSQNELQKITKVVDKHPDIMNVVYGGIAKIPHTYVDKRFVEKFNKKYFEEFMKDFVQTKIQKVSQEKERENLLKKGEISVEDVFQSLGSYGMTELLDTFLDYLMKGSYVTPDQVRDLLDLISGRNEVQNVEMNYLSESYKDYLQTHIQMKNIQFKK